MIEPGFAPDAGTTTGAVNPPGLRDRLAHPSRRLLSARRRRRSYADPAYDMQGRPKQPPTSLGHGKIAADEPGYRPTARSVASQASELDPSVIDEIADRLSDAIVAARHRGHPGRGTHPRAERGDGVARRARGRAAARGLPRVGVRARGRARRVEDRERASTPAPFPAADSRSSEPQATISPESGGEPRNRRPSPAG